MKAEVADNRRIRMIIWVLVLEVLSFSFLNWKFGFGDWDTSDVLTEMSDGRVRTCKITNFKNPDIWHWLMEKDFTKYAHDGPIFLIMDNDRLTFSGDIGHVNGEWKREDLGYLGRGEIVFSDERYTVWRYESIEAFSRATGQEIA